jgi:hypothetical protein
MAEPQSFRERGVKLRSLALPVPASAGCGPTRGVLVANVVVFQVTWFAVVFGAARGAPAWSALCIFCAVAWHLGVAERPAREAMLVGIACLMGFTVETMHLLSGHVSFPASAGSHERLAPYWLVGMWGLLAICLNVSMRWLRGRWWLAAVLGALAGPISFSSGVKLGAAYFVDRSPALVAIAVTWSVALPLMVWLSMRFDGVSKVDERS